MSNIDIEIELVNAKITINRNLERISELEELVTMLIDSETADDSLINVMYRAWLHKAKELNKG